MILKKNYINMTPIPNLDRFGFERVCKYSQNDTTDVVKAYIVFDLINYCEIAASTAFFCAYIKNINEFSLNYYNIITIL